MKIRNRIVLFMLALLVFAGCASTKVTSREQDVTGQLPRPAHIWVYNFAATPADMPEGSSLEGEYSDYDTPQTSEQIEEGRKLGAQIAGELVTQINEMGMPAAQAAPGTITEINDIVLRGYLVSVVEGSAAKRMVIGFGSGASDLTVAVEGFQVTPQGLRKLGSGTTESSGSKKPGGALGVATLLATHNPAGLIISAGAGIYGEKSGKSTVEGRAKQSAKEIADVLKQRFQQQGWID